MKKIGVISDIHANLAALEKALAILDKEAVDGIVVCGDIVGYGRDVNMCCELIRALGCPVVAGNHDSAVVGFTEYRKTFSARACRGITYTLENISMENLSWLLQLPLQITIGKMEFVHASLVSPEQWYYLTIGKPYGNSVYQDVRKSFEVMQGQVCFVGHTHTPAIFMEMKPGQIKAIEPDQPYYELGERRAIIDVGSVGAPRNKSRNASVVIYETGEQRIYFKRFKL